VTTAEQPQTPRPRPPVGEPGLAWAGDGALARRLLPAHTRVAAPVPATRPRGDAAALPDGLTLDRPLATVRRRAAGFAIDVVILALISQVTGFVLLSDADQVSLVSNDAFMRLVFANALIRFGYNWYFSARGWSPGKRVVGIRIVTADGGVPGVGRGFQRAAGAVLSDFVLWLGYLWALWDGRRQTWHDKIAGTYVVLDQERRAEEPGPRA
jgi:uncharacterized RDD family membrane protein YckC